MIEKKMEIKKKSIRSSQLIEQNVLEKDKFTRTVTDEKQGHEDSVIDHNKQNPNHLNVKVVQIKTYDKRSQFKNRFTSNPYNYPYRFKRKSLQQRYNILNSCGTAVLPKNKHDEQKLAIKNEYKYEQGNKRNENMAVKISKPVAKVNPITRLKKKPLGSIKSGRNGTKTGGRPPLFPSSLPPFDNPKDGLLKTLLQMENPEWEVVMLGLQGLVRLCRHHSKLVTASSHSVIQSLVHNIRNLRSQVSRGSCQVAKELFDKVGRFLDAELEDLAGTLLSRTADTNKFLRGDALAALESMVDHTNPVRSVGVLINKGAKHQNALVRCSTARLLLRLAKKLGAERTLSLPRETKDMLVITTAKLLTEGSLDTRSKNKRKRKNKMSCLESKKRTDAKENGGKLATTKETKRALRRFQNQEKSTNNEEKGQVQNFEPQLVDKSRYSICRSNYQLI
ncbi:unnamed protein product [Nezara viridula]|uniref:TOG domain-containing protein n=1 Tax=Nezara viridula TaxID=85310 RepID=A0A9P0HM87_NEZVI|nr:unnamed protein product [Nezara viridula]